MTNYRTPICSTLGHVDHGKTTILDALSDNRLAGMESGDITQSVRVLSLSNSDLADICQNIPEFSYDLPGTIFVDTPGHRAFGKSRLRGSSMSDISILVIDIKDGFQPQTVEALEHLIETETPFIVAVNKIDALPEWETTTSGVVAQTFRKQSHRAKSRIRDSVYNIAGELSEYDISSDFYWNIDDFTKSIGIVPISGKSQEGLADLIFVLSNLSERYLKEQMRLNVTGDPRGRIIRTSNMEGIGDVIDILLVDGVLEKDQEVYYRTRDGVKSTRVNRIMKTGQNNLSEGTFKEIGNSTAASLLRISGSNIDNAIAGSPVGNKKIVEDWSTQNVQTDNHGIVAKTSSKDKSVALYRELNDKEIPIERVEPGSVTKADVIRAHDSDYREDRIIIAYSVDVNDQAHSEAKKLGVEIVESNVIYELIEELQNKREQMEETINASQPAKFRIIDDGIIKSGNPAILGIEILKGTLETGVSVSRFELKNETTIGNIRRIEKDSREVEKASKGEKVAISLSKRSGSKSVEPQDSLYVSLSRKEVEELENDTDLTTSEEEALSEYIESKVDIDRFWY